MEERTGSNRMTLLLLRGRLALARRGLDLLKSRREALLHEFLPLKDRVFSGRETLAEGMGEAGRILALSLGTAGREALGAASLVSGGEIRIDVTRRNLWGVRFPEIRRKTFRRALDARGYAFPGVPPGVDLTAKVFEKVLEEILHLVAEEVKLRNLGEEIKKTGRRIRVIEDRVLPDLVSRIREIRFVLEEREREGVFRMKRQKGKTAGG